MTASSFPTAGSRVDRVGPEAAKAAISDAVARPLPEGVQLDANIWIDPTDTPFNGGMFVHDTPTRADSDLFGDENSGNATDGANLAALISPWSPHECRLLRRACRDP